MRPEWVAKVADRGFGQCCHLALGWINIDYAAHRADVQQNIGLDDRGE